MQYATALISAIAALLGASIGGWISFRTTRFTVGQQHKHQQRMREIEKREKLYSEFVAEVSRLIILCVDEGGANAKEFALLNSLHAQMKIISSQPVLDAAATVVSTTLRRGIPQEITEEGKRHNLNLRSKFTDAARAELEALKATD